MRSANSETGESGERLRSPREPKSGLPRDRWGLGAGIVVITLAIAAGIYWRLSSEPQAPKPPRILVLYAYSALEEAIREDLFPRFQERWRAERSEEVELAATFAGSGALTEQILRRVPVEVAILASAMDAQRLGPTVPWRSWEELPHRGVLARTRIALLVRPGNPLEILRLSDLTRPEVGVVHADPESSGVGQWVVLGLYGTEVSTASAAKAGAQALSRLRAATVATPRSARDALRAFASGTGEVLPTYEQDLLQAEAHGILPGEIVRPARSILVEPTVVVASANVSESQRPMVDAFVRHLWSEEAQASLERRGFDRADAPASTRDDLTLDRLGGALAARREILEGAWRRTARSN